LLALNYSRFLHWFGEHKAALRLLLRQSDHFARLVDAYIYFLTLGELQSCVGDFEGAAKSLEEGKQSAIRACDENHIAMCAAKLAEVHKEMQHYRESETELRTALNHETDNEGRAALLAELLRIQIAAGHEKQASKTFMNARDIADRHQLDDIYIDLHMA